jgi:16S rRNA (uracil1498-N3)-methyltransferase
MPYFYLPDLQANSKHLKLDGDEFHHITHVFRHQVGDSLQFTSGQGVLATATITNITKKLVEVEIIETRVIAISEPPLRVAFALLRNKNDEWLVEKLTELGVKYLYPMQTQFTVRQPSKNVQERFTKTAVAAIKQCENAWLPVIEPVRDMKDLVLHLQEKQIQPLLAAENTQHLFLPDVLTDLATPHCLLIGPEGGFAPEEFEWLKMQNVPFFSLGNHILRAETAAITATSQLLLQYLKANPKYM